MSLEGKQSVFVKWHEKTNPFFFCSRGVVTSIAISQVWNVFVTSATDDSLILWDLRSLTLVRQLSRDHPLQKTASGYPICCVAIDERTGNMAACTRLSISLYDVNGELLACLTTSAATSVPICSVCFVEAQFTVLGAVVLVTGHEDGTVRLYRLDSVFATHVNVGIEPVTDPKASQSLPFFLTEVYAYTAHSSRVTSMCMVPEGMLSSDGEGKVVRVFPKDTPSTFDIQLKLIE